MWIFTTVISKKKRTEKKPHTCSSTLPPDVAGPTCKFCKRRKVKSLQQRKPLGICRRYNFTIPGWQRWWRWWWRWSAQGWWKDALRRVEGLQQVEGRQKQAAEVPSSLSRSPAAASSSPAARQTWDPPVWHLASIESFAFQRLLSPWVLRLVSLTLFAWAFLWISCSSSLTGGTNDLSEKMIMLWRGINFKSSTQHSRALELVLANILREHWWPVLEQGVGWVGGL